MVIHFKPNVCVLPTNCSCYKLHNVTHCYTLLHISNVREIRVIASMMDSMVCSRNVDLSVCSGDVTDLECRFFTQVLPVNVTIYGKLYLMNKLLLSEVVCTHKCV